MRRKTCLILSFLYFIRYTCSFKLSFMRYFYMCSGPILPECLHGQLLGVSGRTFVADNLSGNGHFIRSKIVIVHLILSSCGTSYV